jgi:hypothetical protein
MRPQGGEHARFLRRALRGNALFSVLSGLTILLAPGRVLRILGLSDNVSLAILGFGLLVFAVILLINASRQQVKISDAWIAVLMDLAWVLGSDALIFVVPFSREGKWVVGVVAELVLVFTVLQFVGIRRIQKSERFG